MLLRDFVNKKIASADKEVSAEGVPLTLNDCKKYKKMRDLKVYGNCFQDGTPTPENPIEVQCVGELVTDETDINYGKYKVPIICRGKNYFSLKNANATTQTINGITFTPLGDERIHVKGHLADATKSARYALNGLYIPLKAGVYRSKMHPYERTYKFFINYGTFYTGGSFNFQGPNGAQTLPIDGYIGYVHISVSDGNTTEFDDIIELQVEKSNVSSAYEPHVEPITTNLYLNEPLRKLGTYADYIDGKNDKVVRKCCKRYLANYSFELYEKSVKNDVEICHFNVGDNAIIPSSRYDVHRYDASIGRCNVMPTYASYDYAVFSCGMIMWGWGQNIRFAIPTEYIGEASATAFQNWLSEHNAYMVRVLATPIEEPLNIDLPKLNAKTTIIEVDTSLLPSNISGKYILR